MPSRFADKAIDRPLSSVGLPYYNDLLLSARPANHLRRPITRLDVSSPPQKIPQQILASMRLNDRVAYAALPKELRGKRNVVASSEDAYLKPRFRSDKGGSQVQSSFVFFCFSFENSQDWTPHGAGDIPLRYLQVEIQYSKFGIEDFDFGQVIVPANWP